jgi:hypothetical protein
MAQLMPIAKFMVRGVISEKISRNAEGEDPETLYQHGELQFQGTVIFIFSYG